MSFHEPVGVPLLHAPVFGPHLSGLHDGFTGLVVACMMPCSISSVGTGSKTKYLSSFKTNTSPGVSMPNSSRSAFGVVVCPFREMRTTLGSSVLLEISIVTNWRGVSALPSPTALHSPPKACTNRALLESSIVDISPWPCCIQSASWPGRTHRSVNAEDIYTDDLNEIEAIDRILSSRSQEHPAQGRSAVTGAYT